MTAQEEIDYKLQWSRDNPSLCIIPYESIDIRHPVVKSNNIALTCCCNLNTKQVNIIDIYDPMSELKKSMKDGVLPAACGKCRYEEKNGGQSERIRSILSKDIALLDKFVSDPVTATSRGYELRVLFSTKCGLACRSCNQEASTTYSKITKQKVIPELEEDVCEKPQYWDYITNSIMANIHKKDYLYVHLMGGEPILQLGAIKLLEWLSDQNIIDKIHLRLTTSLAAMPSPKMLGYFERCANVFFSLSIDSVGENYKYVRWPASFDKVERNLAEIIKFNQQSKTNADFNFNIAPVFSLNNIFYIKDYLDYWYNWFNENFSFQIMNTNIVVTTVHLDVQALPVTYRKDLIEILSKCIQHPMIIDYPKESLSMLMFIQSTIQELETLPDDQRLWDIFLSHTAEFDVRTDTQFSIFNSRLYNLLTDKDKNIFLEKVKKVNSNSAMVLPHSYKVA
jgi:hypothetical protein